MNPGLAALRRRKLELARSSIEVIKRCREEKWLPDEREMTLLLSLNLMLRACTQRLEEAKSSRSEAA